MCEQAIYQSKFKSFIWALDFKITSAKTQTKGYLKKRVLNKFPVWNNIIHY